MKKYLAFFRLRFSTGLQYRAAAFAGVATQFAWGFMRILMFQAFYEADPSAFPMSFQGLVSYIWLQQALLMMFSTWSGPTDIFESISSGQVAYEMCRPMDLYTMWWTKICAVRLSKTALRFVPVVAVSLFLPAPYGLVLPKEPATFFFFLLSLVLGFGVMMCMDMLMYGATFYTVSSRGVRILFSSLSDFLTGGILPLSFFPGWLQNILSLLPYSGIQNAPLEIYTGSLEGPAAWNTVWTQLFWLGALTVIGRLMFRKGIRQVVVQGG